jgi:predicted component of type VI protein secretion system
MKFYLIVAKGKKQGMPIPIEVDLFMIGSGKLCQLRAMHDQIGEQHCALIKRDRKVFINDMNSGHPTIVNGTEMTSGEEWPLHAGDHIVVGPLQFMIQYREKELSKKDLEEWAVKCLDQTSSQQANAMDRIESLMGFSKEAENASQIASAILDKMSAKRGVVKGRLRIAREGTITIVRVNDIYLVDDAELSMIKRELQENLDRPNLRILLDLKNVKRMSTSAAEMFGEVKDWLHAKGSRMAICRMKPELQNMIINFPDLEGVKFFADKQVGLAGNW